MVPYRAVRERGNIIAVHSASAIVFSVLCTGTQSNLNIWRLADLFKVQCHKTFFTKGHAATNGFVQAKATSVQV